MKRLLTATLLALGIHGLLLGLTINSLERTPFHPLNPKVLTMTLVMRQPVTNIPDLSVKPPKPPVKKPEPVKQIKKKPVRTHRPVPKPEKIVKPVVKPEQKDIVKATPEPVVESSTVPDTPVHTEMSKEMSTVLEKPPVVGTPGQADEITREARPLYRINPPPPYPRIARKRGFQGVVVLEVLVDQNGYPADLRVLTSSGHPILDRTAMASVKKWIFEPGTRGSKKVEMWVRVPIRFELK